MNFSFSDIKLLCLIISFNTALYFLDCSFKMEFRLKEYKAVLIFACAQQKIFILVDYQKFQIWDHVSVDINTLTVNVIDVCNVQCDAQNVICWLLSVAYHSHSYAAL